MISENIKQLVQYGLDTGLVSKEDTIYVTNRILEVLKETTYEEPESVPPADLETILGRLTDYAVSKGLLEHDSVVYRDLFDTQLMGCLTPPPSPGNGPVSCPLPGKPGKSYRLFLQIQPGYQLHPALPDFQRHPLEIQQPLRGTGHYHQPFQTGKRSKGNRRCPPGKIRQLPKMSPLQGKCGICRPRRSSCQTEPPDHPSDHQPVALGIPVFALCLLQ